MLSSIPQALFAEWQVFDELEPDILERSDWNFAHVVQVLARTGKQLGEYLLPFGDRASLKAVQTVAYQEMLINAWCDSANTVHREKTGG